MLSDCSELGIMTGEVQLAIKKKDQMKGEYIQSWQSQEQLEED